MENLKLVGSVAAVLLPFWNIPLILRILKRRSSEDISLTWVIGVWICVMLMLPSAVVSHELAFRLLGMINAFFFTCVFLVVLWYHPSVRPVRSAAPPK